MHQVLHNLYWSLRQGELHELFFKDSLTLATWGLVVVTLMLVVDSWKKDKEQRQRWERADNQRLDDRQEEQARRDYAEKERLDLSKPRFYFWLQLLDRREVREAWDQSLHGPVCLWFANLGTSGLYVSHLYIKYRDHEPVQMAFGF